MKDSPQSPGVETSAFAAFEFLHWPVLVTDADYRVQYANQWALNTFKAPRGRLITELISLSDTDLLKVKSLINNEVLRINCVAPANGTAQYAKLLVNPLNGNDGACCFMLTPGIDKDANRQALEEEKDFYKLILDNLPADIAVFSPDKRYLYVNQHAIKDFELRKWLIGKDDFQFCERRGMPASFALERKLHFEDFLSTDADEVTFEESMEKDGAQVTSLRVHKKVNDEQGELEYVVGYGVNISKLKEYENHIRNLQTSINVSTDGIAILDANGCYTYLNPAHVSLYGYTKLQEMMGKSWKMLYKEEEIERIEKEIFPILSSKRRWSGETLGLTKDGHEIHTEISLSILPDGGMVCTCRDVTERKLRDLELQRLAVVASKTNSMVVITDGTARINWVNEAFERKTGFMLEEVKNHYPGEFLDGPETDPAVTEKLKEITSRGQAFAGEKLSYMKDGTPVWFYINANPVFNSDGQLTNWVSVETDITLLKEAEQKVKEALDKERYLSELKSRFVSMASHEFRTPLAGILTSIELVKILLEKNRKSYDVKIDMHLERAIEEIDRMTAIMDNILLFGKMQSGKFPFRPQRHDIRLFLSQLVDDIQMRHPHRQILFSHAGQGKHCFFDEKQMAHVFTNIIENALKYSPEDKPVMVELADSAFGYRIEVADHGIGIPKNEQPLLFDSFFRASNAENIQGTGMGLVIAKQFVDAHQGKIQIESEAGDGCKVIVELSSAPK